MSRSPASPGPSSPGVLADARVRLDKWLWAARFFKTRTLASEAVELGRVRIDGERAKPALAVRPGLVLTITSESGRIEVVVRALSDRRGPAPVARLLYEETTDSCVRREREREARQFAAEPSEALRGRPTKRDARVLRRIRDS